MILERTVPFGRSLDEYIKIFKLDSNDLGSKILSVADGPASFNAELSTQGGDVTSVDPIYAFDEKQIETQFYSVLDNIIEQVKATPDDWTWSYHKSAEDLKSSRINVTKSFVKHFEEFKNTDRYIIGELPSLLFKANEFNLALCSHFLFLYSDHFNYEFHLLSILEMLRVSKEVRIFPLMTLMLQKSPYVDQIIKDLTSKGYEVNISKSDYELQKGGNEMMVIKSKQK